MPKFSFQDNEKLIRYLKMGDKACFRYVYNELIKPLTVFTLGYTKDRDLAEDIVQYSFMRLWEKRTVLDPHAPLKTFLFTMCRNRFIDLYRKNKKNVFLTDIAYTEAVLETEGLSDEKLKARLDQIDKAVEILPKKCKEIFILKRRDNLKNKEIAEYLGISIKTVEDHNSRALRLIKAQVGLILFWTVFTLLL